MDKYLYIAINIASVSVPFLASFYSKHPFYKQWKNFFIANAVVALLFILWDILFTAMGVWGFNDRYLLGMKLVNIPIEEVLFFFCIPYASVFVYFSLNYLVRKNPIKDVHRQITLVLAVVLGGIGLVFWDRLYTSVTFIVTSAYLFFNFFQKNDLSKSYFSYAVTLFFFFIVNGILTGTGIDEPVVWYNNNENLGIRIGTIPVEDVFYGFLLIVSIIQIYEYLNGKSEKSG